MDRRKSYGMPLTPLRLMPAPYRVALMHRMMLALIGQILWNLAVGIQLPRGRLRSFAVPIVAR